MPDIFVAPKHQKKDHKRLHPFTLRSFSQNPIKISFQDQEEDEKILLLLRSHPVTNIPWIFITFLFTAIPLVFSLFNFKFFTFGGINFSDIPLSFTIFFLIFYYLVVFNYALINFMNWYYNVFLVTQKRVVDIDFFDLVYHNVALTKVNLIQDADYTQVGFIQSLFDYGNVFIQTAADKPNFEALKVPKPAIVMKTIEELMGRRRHAT